MHPRQQHWDERHASAHQPGEPAVLLRDNLHLLPPAGDALDLACGLGANALLLARQGLDTRAWDLSPVALGKLAGFAARQGLTIHTDTRDIEQHPPPPASLDVIVVSQFLHRPLCPALAEALRPGGLLFYQTWTAQKVTTTGPTNPEYLLAPNELLALFPTLQVIVYREEMTCGNLLKGLRNQACLIARKPT